MHGRAESIDAFVTSTMAELAHCRQDDVVRGTSLVDLGVDSLAMATLVAFIEAEYGCIFVPTQLRALYSASRVDELLLAVRQVVCG